MLTNYKYNLNFNLILDIPPEKQGVRQNWTLTEGVADEKSLFGGIDVSRQIKKQRVSLIIYEHSEDTF